MQVLRCAALALASMLALASQRVSAVTREVQVRTDAGVVAGNDVGGGKVIAFKGIRYAAAPTGDLRWKPPQPVQSWAGVRAADKFGASCMQATPQEQLPWTPVFMTRPPVSEDCLFLNVWTPQTRRGAALPVVVFIHGGAFVEGAGSVGIYNGAHLADHGVVVVTINYRLGVFGFLATRQLAAESPRHAAGNYGLMDQIAALRWVQKNIAGFGGDPKNVTIWGQSAGAMSVEALVLSPLAKGLFQHAQVDSGLGVSTRLMRKGDLEAVERAGAAFAKGIDAKSPQALRQIPAGTLLHDAQQFARTERQPFAFSPVVDGWVLPAAPRELLADGAGSSVPIMAGWNANDWMLFQPRVTTVREYRKLAERFYGSMAANYLRLYPASTVAQAQAMQVVSSGDRESVETALWAQQRRAHDKVARPVYLYSFQRAIPWPAHPEFGAFHSSELPYFFLNTALMDRPWQQEDRDLSEHMAEYLLRFAATGDPNGPGLPHWQPLGGGVPSMMRFGPREGTVPICSSRARCAFWRQYFRSADAHEAPLF